MSNGDVNRHGIPRYRNTEGQCCWPRCYRGSSSHILRLCDVHAGFVYELVQQERDQKARAWREKIQRKRPVDDYLPPPSPPAAPPRDGVIYYAQIGGHIKVGWTSQLEKRMRHYPPNTTLLAIHPGTRDDERKIHQRFAGHRSHGQEWYPLVPVLLEHIKRVVADHGPAPEITFGARPVQPPMPHRDQPAMRARQSPMQIA